MSVRTDPGPVLPPPSGAPVTVTVHADRTAREGAVVLATVRIRASRDVVLQGGEVTLRCALSYRYITGGIFGATHSSVERRTDVVATQPLPGPTLLRAGAQVEHQVLLAVPVAGPPTAVCELVTVGWTIHAEVRFEGRERAEAAPVAIVVLGTGRDASLAAGTVMERGRPGVVDLEEVSTRVLAAGTRVSGIVVVGRAAGVRSVKVELVLVQLVPQGPVIYDEPGRNPYIAPKEAEAVVVRLHLVGDGHPAEVGPGDRLPFSLEVPALPAPSLVTKEFSLQWVLRATLRRRVGGVPLTTVADLEVRGSTAPLAS